MTQANRQLSPSHLESAIAQTIQGLSGCTPAEALREATFIMNPSSALGFSPWRHGGWYVHGVRYPNGASGCVSSNYPDKKWRIAIDSRRSELNGPGDHTFNSREEAARAEQHLALDAWKAYVEATLPSSVATA